jgi:tetratricopeptide (TPR) repeat protein
LGVRDKARAQLQLAFAKAQTPMVRGRILQELGTLSAAQGDRAAGRKLLEDALGLIPGDFQIRMDLGNLLGAQGESVYRQAAASVSPSDLRWAIAMTQVGRLRLEAGDLAQASTILADATASLRLAPGPPPEVVPALIAFARLKRIQRNPTGAAILIEEAIRVGGLTPTLEQESRYLRVLEGRGEEVVEVATSSGQALVAGLAWTRLGKPLQGEPLLRLAVNGAKGTIDKGEALAALAECLERLERVTEAMDVRRQAITVYEQGFGAFAASYPAWIELRAAR